MANITKQKRDEMLAFLEQLKADHNDDAAIRAFNEIQNHLTEKKFGLVFEEHTEEVDEKLLTHIPVFRADKDRRLFMDESKPWNFIIEGDNLQALYLLEKTHRGQVDCIYIDPPYNTGATDWKYNNKFVDEKDTFRHSKWLSMMSARLNIAKHLLKEDGVLVCAIDENELATLTLLIEHCFGQSYSIDTVCVVHNPRGIQGDNFSYVNEYALFVYKKGKKVIATREVSEDEVDWSPLRNWGTESLRTDAANCFYPIFVKDNKIVGFGEDVTALEDFHPQKNEFDAETGVTAVYPIDKEGVERKWRYARQTVESIIDLLRVKEANGIFDIELGKDFAPFRTVWNDKKYDANEYGTQLISGMVPDNDFSFPKSLYNVQDCILAVTKNKPNAIIVDFFAGSGTTGHAVLEINKLFGGNRRFILCTNNAIGDKKEKAFKKEFPHCVTADKEIIVTSEEYGAYEERYGIARAITFPRIKATIEGFVHKKDFKEELFSCKLTYSRLKTFSRIQSQIDEIIATNEGAYDDIKVEVDNNSVIVYGVSKKGKLVEGIPANVKYFKSDWTPRKPEDYLLSNALCLHIREMIELQNHIEIDNKKYVLILNKSDFNKYVMDPDAFEQIEQIWVNQNIVFDPAQLKLLRIKNFKYVPREFFGQELREAAE